MYLIYLLRNRQSPFPPMNSRACFARHEKPETAIIFLIYQTMKLLLLHIRNYVNKFSYIKINLLNILPQYCLPFVDETLGQRAEETA